MNPKLLEMNKRLASGEEPILKISPEELNYKDRGMIKWQGFLLSDHVEAMKRKRKKRLVATPTPRKKQTMEEISQHLLNCYTQKNPVLIQRNSFENGHLQPNIVGHLIGYKEETVYVHTFQNKLTLSIEDIRHVSPLSPQQYDEWLIERKED